MTSAPPEALAAWLDGNLGWENTQFCSALSGGNSNLTWQFRSGDRAKLGFLPTQVSIQPSSERLWGC